jgi:hypothetical protein
MDRDDQPPPPRTPKKKGKAPEQPGTPSAAVPTETGPPLPNSLAACIEAGDIYTVKLGGANGGVVGVGETGGMSAAEIEEEAKRARDTPAPTKKQPCVKPTTEQCPRVVDPNWLGDGPGPDHYKYESDTSKELREVAWTPYRWVIFLRMQYWLITSRGFRPMCCLCLGILFLITANLYVRAVYAAALGCIALSNRMPVLARRQRPAQHHAFTISTPRPRRLI